jgi:hypothetical protein
MKLKLPIVCAVSLALTSLCGLGCGNTHSTKPDTVLVPKAEYEQLKADAALLKKYEETVKLREQAIAENYHQKYPSLFDACGNPLDSDGKRFDPKDWPGTPLPPSASPR